MFCTPKFKVGNGPRQEKDTVRLRHGCQVTKTCVNGFGEHMCRSCHQTGTQRKTPICTYTACSRPHTFCKHLHAQEDAMKTSATEAAAVQVSVLFPWGIKPIFFVRVSVCTCVGVCVCVCVWERESRVCRHVLVLISAPFLRSFHGDVRSLFDGYILFFSPGPLLT